MNEIERLTTENNIMKNTLNNLNNINHDYVKKSVNECFDKITGLNNDVKNISCTCINCKKKFNYNKDGSINDIIPNTFNKYTGICFECF